jgi:hypothetical protein
MDYVSETGTVSGFRIRKVVVYVLVCIACLELGPFLLLALLLGLGASVEA